NLVEIVFDNESLLSVGGFPTATATGTDLAAVARGAGIAGARTVTDLDDFVSAVRAALAGTELACIVAKVDAVGPGRYLADSHPLEDRFVFARTLREPPRNGGKMP